jgi:hypothetical protein
MFDYESEWKRGRDNSSHEIAVDITPHADMVNY